MAPASPVQSAELLVSRPSTKAELETFAAEVQELVLYLRDEGHVLSSIDQHFVEQWWDAGYPLDVVLRVLLDQGRKLKARKRPPRGLPLKSMRRQVEKAGLSALRRSVGAPGSGGSGVEERDGGSPPPDGSDEAGRILTRLLADVADAVEDRRSRGLNDEALEASRMGLEALRDGALGGAQLLGRLLAVGREYYDALWRGQSEADRRRIRQEVTDGLGKAVLSMSPESLDETVVELCRRRLRVIDDLFDPQRYWEVS